MVPPVKVTGSGKGKAKPKPSGRAAAAQKNGRTAAARPAARAVLVEEGMRPRRAAARKSVDGIRHYAEDSESEDEFGNLLSTGRTEESATEVDENSDPEARRLETKARAPGRNGSHVLQPKQSKYSLNVPTSPGNSFSSLPPSSQLAAMDRVSVETPEQRAATWALAKMDTLVWVAVPQKTGHFWWPADVSTSY